MLKGRMGDIHFVDTVCGRAETVVLRLTAFCFSCPLVVIEAVSVMEMSARWLFWKSF
jgi:hypothetical protein